MTTQKKASKLLGKDPKSATPSKPKILIFGKSGVGKTWASIDFPNVYYIDCEGGANLNHYTDKLKAANGAYMGPEDGSLAFETVINQIEALATEEHQYKTVVIDSITKLESAAVAAQAKILGDKNAYGADKKPAIAFMRQLVNWLVRLDMNVILVAHEKSEWGQDAKGERTQIGVTFDCWPKAEYELNLVLQIQKRGASRVAVVKKSRIEAFPDLSSFPWSYADFAEKYGKEVMEKAATQIVLATTEEVSEAKRLVGLLKLTDEQIEKAFTKYQVESFAEMSTETIKEVIAKLKENLK